MKENDTSLKGQNIRQRESAIQAQEEYWARQRERMRASHTLAVAAMKPVRPTALTRLLFPQPEYVWYQRLWMAIDRKARQILKIHKLWR